jgi:hypothetical protein
MTEQEKATILEQVANLPETAKEFILGYAAGRAADIAEKTGKADEQDKTESA